MKHFTLFTFLYLAAGACLTAIFFGNSDITPNVKTILLINAGLLYLTSVLSTFPFWRNRVLQSEARLRDQPAWDRNIVMILPIFIIVLMLVITIPDLVNHNWTTPAIARASVGLLVILLNAEQLFIRNQIRQES